MEVHTFDVRYWAVINNRKGEDQMKGQQVKSPSSTIKLLRTIGSPFAPEQKQVLPENKEEALELYEYATKNKIGLAYLESLKDQERLEEFGLKGI